MPVESPLPPEKLKYTSLLRMCDGPRMNRPPDLTLIRPIRHALETVLSRHEAFTAYGTHMEKTPHDPQTRIAEELWSRELPYGIGTMRMQVTGTDGMAFPETLEVSVVKDGDRNHSLASFAIGLRHGNAELHHRYLRGDLRGGGLGGQFLHVMEDAVAAYAGKRCQPVEIEVDAGQLDVLCLCYNNGYRPEDARALNELLMKIRSGTVMIDMNQYLYDRKRPGLYPPFSLWQELRKTITPDSVSPPATETRPPPSTSSSSVRVLAQTSTPTPVRSS